MSRGYIIIEEQVNMSVMRRIKLGKAIAIFNQKGGVGKTTTNINLGACLALKGKRVLMLDIDPQGNTTSGIGVSKKELEYTVYELLIEDNFDPRDAVLHTSVENLDLIPANVDLAGAEIEMVQLEGREKRLQKAIDKIRNDYDYIFIDCPPSLGLLTINSLSAVESVLIPIQCEFYALEGVSPSFGMPIVEYDPRSKGAEAYREFAEEFLEREGVL